MNRTLRRWTLLVFLASPLTGPDPAGAATLHVWPESPDSEPPFPTWESAARDLQQALDEAKPGDTVLVTNGVYATGARLAQGAVLNRIVVPAGVTVRSVSGPEFTVLEGAPRVEGPANPGGTGATKPKNDHGHGDGAIRCVWLGPDAALHGFTLRHGHTRTNGPYDLDQSGGGVWGEPGSRVIDCVLTNNGAHYMGGGAFRAELLQCRISENQARYGGGACLATVSDSLLLRNSAENGGGAYQSRLTRCMVSTNDANMGGGLMGGSMLECFVSGNVAGQWGGGLYQVTAQKCRIEGNEAERGGGAFISTLFASVLTRNTGELGGGAAGGTLRHCTVTRNAGGNGGGVYLVNVHNSIVYHNDAVLGPNHEGSSFTYSCTTPLPDSGLGNLAQDPQLASDSHLASTSPCRAPDAAPPELPTDLDGEAWQQPSSMGCDQVVEGQATGALTVDIVGGATTVAAGFPVEWHARIEGRTTASEWSLGDGRTIRNQPFVHLAWDQPGTYQLTLTAYNDSHPEGVPTPMEIRVVEPPVLHVAAGSNRPTPPFAGWDTAANTLQAAVDAATVPGSVVLVTNGVYNRGGGYLPGDVLLNRVAITRPIVVRSVNGPSTTFLTGIGPVSDFAVRCAYVGRDAVLSGFTLTNGHTRTAGARPREQRGGGVAGEARGLVTNCVLVGNVGREFGGGANRAILRDCVLLRNRSFDGAGGAYESVLETCTLDGNQAANTGGGASRSLLTRCRLVANSAALGAGAYLGTLEDCRLEANVTEGNGYGGGAHGSLLRDCVLTHNVAYSGGGAYSADLRNCRLEGNTARRDGGGATDSRLENCTLSANSANHGGGASESTLSDCTLGANRAWVTGGGVTGGRLERCTLTNNAAFHGGAADLATLERCVLRGNSAQFGGAGHESRLVNCLLTGNVATNQGGATFRSQLANCTVVANRAEAGGGLFQGVAENSIVYFNTAPAGPDFLGSGLAACCTAPSPLVPPGNYTNAPLFLDPDAGNYRLRGDSPGIDVGIYPDEPYFEDLAGNLRPVDGDLDLLVDYDLGAYEYDPETTDTNGDGIPDAWYRHYRLDFADPDAGQQDPDGDRLTNQQEWITDTDPTDPGSAFSVAVSNLPPVTISVPGLPGRIYTLLARPHLDPVEGDAPPWLPVPGQEGIPGHGETLALTDTNALAASYYRVEVRLGEPALRAATVPVPGGRSLAAVPLAKRSGAARPALLDPFQARPIGPDEGLAQPWPFAGFAPEPASAPAPAGWPALPAAESPGPTDTRSLAARSVGSTGRIALAKSPAPAPMPALPHRCWVPSEGDFPISPMLRGQEAFMLYAQSARRASLEWGRGTTFRGVAGGTDAETYHWKELSARSRPHAWSYHPDDPPVVTTLEWLEEARDYDAELVITVNTRGRGRWIPDPTGRPKWVLDPASNHAGYLARLAADWVRYANLVAPTYRLTPEGQLPVGLERADPEAARLLAELAALGNGTNAWRYRLATVADPSTEVDPWLERPLLSPADRSAPTRRVKYWEIGNEVETSMAVVGADSPRLVDSAIDLSPAQYVERYLRMTSAMRGVDSGIRVGPSPNAPTGARAGLENEHLVDLLARPDAEIDVLFYHYYLFWYGSYDFPDDVRRNLRMLKGFGYALHNQYAALFARAGRSQVPAIVSEWNPDWLIHGAPDRLFLSALATAEAFFTMVELGVLGAHYWDNPESRASSFVFDRLATHLGDRLLAVSYGNRADDGSYVGFGRHPSAETDVRIYVTQRSADGRVFVWMLNFSPTTPFTVAWEHPRPVVEARTWILGDPEGTTTFQTPVHRLAWVERPVRSDQPTSTLPPASLSILELTYAPAPPSSPAAPSITTLSRVHGPKDAEVVIDGAGFAETPDGNVVHFGHGRATVLEASRSRLRVRLPATATYGPVTVTAGGWTGWSRTGFCPAGDEDGDAAIGPDSLVPLPGRILPPEWAPLVTAPLHLLLLDWRNDGRLHLAGVTSRTGAELPDTIDLFPNTGHPGRPAFETPSGDPQMPLGSLPLNASPAGIASADFDGDGQLDLACVDRNAWHVATWRNAWPVPGRSFDVMNLAPTGASPSALAIHDLDQDGRPDLLVTQVTHHSLGLIRNRTAGPGTLLFETNQIFRPSNPNQMLAPHALAVGDLLGDARPEVVVASRTSASLTVFENLGAPGRPQLLARPDPIEARVESIALGDIDGDGRLDLVATGPWPQGGLWIWRNTGTGLFERFGFPTARDPRQFCLTDLSGDGRPDVVTANADTSSVSVLRNRSHPGWVDFDARKDFRIPGLLPNDPVCLVAGDLDGDGWPDVAVGHYQSGFVTLLHNRVGR